MLETSEPGNQRTWNTSEPGTPANLEHQPTPNQPFHTRRREDIESGSRPTVQESLARLN
jgi:hypothetical protein